MPMSSAMIIAPRPDRGIQGELFLYWFSYALAFQSTL